MRQLSRRPASWLFLLIDILHCTAIAASASVVFSCVLMTPLPLVTTLWLSAALTVFFLFLLRSKLVRRVLLVLLAFTVTSAGLLAVATLFSRRLRARGTLLLTAVGEWFSAVNWSAAFGLLVVVLAALLTALAATFGRRTLYLCVLSPALAVIILSLFGAEFPVWALFVLAVSMALLVIRRRYDWFSELWVKEAAGKAPAEVSAREEAQLRKPRKFPNLVVRAVCLLAAGALILGVARAELPDGPLFGRDFTDSLSQKFESFVLSHPNLNRFFTDVLGITLGSPSGSLGSGLLLGSGGPLGGPTEEDRTPALWVRTNEGVDTIPQHPLYLRGFTYNNYTGTSWVPDSGRAEAGLLYRRAYGPRQQLVFAHRERELAFSPLSQHEEVTVSVLYIDPFSPRSGVFVPNTAQTIELLEDGSYSPAATVNAALQLNSGLNLISTATRKPDWNGYSVVYDPAAERADNIALVYRDCVPGYYRNFIYKSDSYGGLSGDGVILSGDGKPGSYYSRSLNAANYLSNYADSVRGTYSSLPASVPARVTALAHSLTDRYTYDWEKATAIKNYLLSGKYRYTLTPDTPPAGVDFVDYFLFDAPEGYCSYFASAMTVLARAAGLTARYAEGFIVTGSTERDGAWYKVPFANLHAWCEVYLEGLGFVTVDATAGFGTRTELNTPTPVPTATPTPRPTPTATLEPSEPPETNVPEPTATPESLLTPEPTAEPPVPQPAHVPTAIKILIISAIVIILIAAVLWLICRLSVKTPGAGASAESQIRTVYRRYAAVLARFTRARARAETPAEYLKALNRLAPEADTGTRASKLKTAAGLLEPFAELTGIYEKVVYGDAAAEETDRERAVGCWNRMTEILKAERGRLRAALLIAGTVGKR